MSAIEAGVRAPGSLWRSEIKATLSLAWPRLVSTIGQLRASMARASVSQFCGEVVLAAIVDMGSRFYPRLHRTDSHAPEGA